MSPEYSAIKKSDGFGLPAAIFVITILALVIAAMSAITQRSAQSVSLQVQSQRAFYAAESGVQLALNLLFPVDGSPSKSCAVSPYYSENFSAAGLNSCAVSVGCRSVFDGTQVYYILTSSGSCGSGADQAVRELEVMVQ